MPNVNSYWLTKAIDFIDVLADSGTKEEIKTKNQMIVEFYSLIKEDFKKKKNLKLKLLAIKDKISGTQFEDNWKKELKYIEADIEVLESWLTINNHIEEQLKKEEHYTACELIRMFKK